MAKKMERAEPRRAMAGSVLSPAHSGDSKVASITDTCGVTSYEEYEPEEPRGWSPLAVALIATLVLLLGLGGALFGINVADRNKQVATDQILPQGMPTQTVPDPSLPAATTPPPAGDTSALPFALPDLAGMDFQEARAKVRELKLGWRLVFEGSGTDATVRTTDPEASTMVKRGDTVKILVKGGAPLATVPGVSTLPCSQAATIIVDQGLYPEYETGREGVVLSQTPSSSDPQTLHWNDLVKIRCGTAP
jgi:hypothetical protein